MSENKTTLKVENVSKHYGAVYGCQKFFIIFLSYLKREALTIIEIDSPLEEKVLTDLRNLEAVNAARQVKL